MMTERVVKDNLTVRKYLIVILAIAIALVVFIANEPERFYIYNAVWTNRINQATENVTAKASYPTQHFICPTFVGGTGNNLFQFASAYGIARSKGMKVIINANCQLLQIFNLKADIREDTTICNSPQVQTIKENRSAAFDITLMKFRNTSDVKLATFLQSYLYFDKYSDELRQQFTFKDSIQRKADVLLETHLRQYGISRKNKTRNEKSIYYQQPDRSPNRKITLIGVHIRRGDWIKEAYIGRTVATKEYLRSAVKWYQSKYQNLVFVVASNGLNWAKENMPKNITSIYLEGTRSPWDDMATLTLCEHFIATVGTYSWWGGWLTGGNVTYFKWPASEGTRFRLSFSKDFSDHFYPSWIGL